MVLFRGLKIMDADGTARLFFFRTSGRRLPVPWIVAQANSCLHSYAAIFIKVRRKAFGIGDFQFADDDAAAALASEQNRITGFIDVAVVLIRR